MSPPRRSILLVDDDKVDVMAVRRALRAVDDAPELVVAQSAEQALEVLRQRPVHLVLLDLNLPGHSGLSVLRTVRADPALAGLVIYVISTSSAERDVRAAYEHQIAGCILKSGFHDELIEILGALTTMVNRLIPPPR